jgi:alkanesulfonate monooxygenase
MPLMFHWFLPTYGDSRNIVGGGHGAPESAARRDRKASISYLGQVATAAEDMGFEGALTPTGLWCEDAWVSTAALIQNTRRLKFLVAFRPGLVAPTLAAQMATTFQHQSDGRLLLNVVTGGEPAEQKAFGDFLSKDERYERCNEFLTIVRKLWEHGEPFNFNGKHLSVEQARLQSVPIPAPPLYFGGSSAAAGPVAAEHSDVYLTWGEPLEAVEKKIDWIRTLAANRGRTIKFGIRLHVITRDTAEQAWAEADRLLKALPAQTIAKVQEGLNRSESEGQRRMLALHGGDSGGLEIAPNLWAGVGLGRGGAGTALVGSHQEVAARIREYARIGIDEFILSGYPHLEEAYWFGEGVLPLLEADGLWTHPDTITPLPVNIPFSI